MSTPISKALILVAAFGLAACEQGGLVSRSAPSQVQLADGLIVAGTRGWCIDKRTSRLRAATPVVVLGSCAAIARNARAPRPDIPGVVTVSVDDQAGGLPSPEVLEQFVASDAGRAVLARDGRPESVEILETRQQSDLFLIHVEDRSGKQAPGAAQRYWRALFELDGRFVTLSLVSPDDQPIDAEAGFDTLVAQASRMRAANRV